MKKILFGSFLVVGLSIIIFIISITSNISPDDIELYSTLRPLIPSSSSIEKQAKKVKLTINLNNKSPKILFNRTDGYFYTVYIYTPQGYNFLTIDYPDQVNSDKFHIGYDSRTRKLAAKSLIENKDIVFINKEGLDIAEGFMYTDHKFPISIDYYFAQAGEYDLNENFYVIFSFYQKRFGKDLSWAEIYSVQCYD